MKKFRLIVVSAAVAAAFSTIGAAPASAQVGCTTITVPSLVNCALDNVQWALDEAERLPDQAIENAQAEVNRQIAAAQAAVIDAGNDVDALEKQVIDSVCWIALETDNCVSR